MNHYTTYSGFRKHARRFIQLTAALSHLEREASKRADSQPAVRYRKLPKTLKRLPVVDLSDPPKPRDLMTHDWQPFYLAELNEITNGHWDADLTIVPNVRMIREAWSAIQEGWEQRTRLGDSEMPEYGYRGLRTRSQRTGRFWSAFADAVAAQLGALAEDQRTSPTEEQLDAQIKELLEGLHDQPLDRQRIEQLEALFDKRADVRSEARHEAQLTAPPLIEGYWSKLLKEAPADFKHYHDDMLATLNMKGSLI